MSHTALLKSVELESPYAVLESGTGYSIVLNMLGINKTDIQIGLDQTERELGILAKRTSSTVQRGLYWIFNIPADGLMEKIRTRYQGGVLEIVIPKGSRV